MTTYYKQNTNTNTNPFEPAGLDSSKSYNSILDELHDCILTKSFMDKAIQPYHNTQRASLPIAPTLSVNTRTQPVAKSFFSVSPASLPIAPTLSLNNNNTNASLPIAPTLSINNNNNTNASLPIAPCLSINNGSKELIKDSEEDELLIPSHKDTLFWCFYIIKYGVQAYFTLGNRQFIVEKQEKISAIELLREKKELLKQHKIKPFTSIEEDLSHNPTISVKTFFALLIAHDLGATYLHKDTFVEVNMHTGKETHIIQYVRPNVYAYLQEPTHHKRNTRIANKYQWVSLDKPVLAMTTYKSEELLELFAKLHIESSLPSDKKPTKKEIYDAILAYFL